MAYRVSERTREIGLRMALGATRRNVGVRVLSRALGLTSAGIAIGIAASLVLGRLVQSLLFGVPPRDPLSLGLAPLILLLAAGIAVWIPARRAMTIDPMGAMRSD
jgi:ABC-type antimicrobial peptide transport system permease subunit